MSSVSSAVLHNIQRPETWSNLHVRKDENSQRLVAVARDALSRSDSAADDYASHSFTATTAGSKYPLHRHWAGGKAWPTGIHIFQDAAGQLVY